VAHDRPAAVFSVPVIGLMPGQAVGGLVVDWLVLVLAAVSWLRRSGGYFMPFQGGR
jgi:hypothetical protein